VTVDSLAWRQATRNELVTALLGRLAVEDDTAAEVRRQHFMEKRGDGVPIILHESSVLSGRVPEYRLIDDAALLLTIWSVVERGTE